MAEREQHGDATAARQAILARLRREYPDSVDLTAHALGQDCSDADFLSACVALQDEGLIMYEALLVGTGARPTMLAAVLTRKGQASPFDWN